MTASERLRELSQFPNRGQDVYPVLLDALPQLISVLEAAELVAWTETFGAARDWKDQDDRRQAVARALTALREHLEGGDVT